MPYRDIGEMNGNLCHIKVTGLSITEEKIKAEGNYKLECCNELKTNT